MSKFVYNVSNLAYTFIKFDTKSEIPSLTKRESKVRAADQIVRLNPDIFGDVILRASDISLLIDTAGLILEVIYNTENKNLGDMEHWRTRNIRDFITKESGIKLEEILNLSYTLY